MTQLLSDSVLDYIDRHHALTDGRAVNRIDITNAFAAETIVNIEAAITALSTVGLILPEGRGYIPRWPTYTKA